LPLHLLQNCVTLELSSQSAVSNFSLTTSRQIR
jgi:hypothetical protein